MFRLFFLLAVLAVPISIAWLPEVPIGNSRNPANSKPSSSTTTTTSLSALPPMIIGPMIKKMREKEAQKKAPMADPREQEGQAPGLRVGRNSWKWPSVWPYEPKILLTEGESSAQAKKTSVQTMAGMLTGGMPTLPAEASEEEDDTAFKPLEFWAQQETTAFTMDPEATQKLTDHFAFYLRDGASILEFGAGKDSYLGDLKPSRHVGVSLNPDDMAANPSLTDRLVVDLNKVEPDRDVDSDDLRNLAKEPFDAVILTNTIPFLTSPREVFRSAWYLLKPGGIMFVAFSSKESTKNFFGDAQTVMWRQYNDDQHIWITGSFFEFSAGDGWDSLLGFDISPASAKEMNTGDNPISKVLGKKGKDNNMYVVQATKAYQDETIDPNNPEKYIKAQTWMFPVMEARDKTLVVPRLARAYQQAQGEQVRKAIARNVDLLPTVYEALIKMDQFSFTFSMQAQMATDLVSDPDFTASEEQMLALKQGLGLRTPSPEFWVPVGQNTAKMAIEDKINLLGFIVPRFGSGNPAQEEALQAFATGLKPTYAVIRHKCPDLTESDVQLLGIELLATEILTVGRSSKAEFANWLVTLRDDELRNMLATRKSYSERSKQELETFKTEREQAKVARDEYQRIMGEQVQTAREERSLIFNPKTKKMEIYKNPNKKNAGPFAFLGGGK